MKSLSQPIIDALQAESYTTCQLVELHLASVYRYNDLDIDVWDGGSRYFSRGLRVEATQLSIDAPIDNLSFSIDNTALEISALFANQQLQGKRCVVWRAMLDGSTYQLIGKVLVFDGVIDNVQGNHEKGDFEAVDRLIVLLKRKTPRRKYTPTCPLVFKSTVCGYTGAQTSCDKSWDRCKQLGNQDNHRGFPCISAVEGKKIPWGRALEV